MRKKEEEKEEDETDRAQKKAEKEGKSSQPSLGGIESQLDDDRISNECGRGGVAFYANAEWMSVYTCDAGAIGT